MTVIKWVFVRDTASDPRRRHLQVDHCHERVRTWKKRQTHRNSSHLVRAVCVYTSAYVCMFVCGCEVWCGSGTRSTRNVQTTKLSLSDDHQTHSKHIIAFVYTQHWETERPDGTNTKHSVWIVCTIVCSAAFSITKSPMPNYFYAKSFRRARSFLAG